VIGGGHWGTSSLTKKPVIHGPMRDPPAHHMRVRQPTEEGRDLAVCLRPDNKVPMVRQDTVGWDADRVSLVRLDHDPVPVSVPVPKPNPD